MRIWIVAFIAIAVVGCSKQPTESVRELRSSLIGLDVAVSQGVSFPKFSDLVLDARTKFEIAKPDLEAKSIASIERAVVVAEKTKTVWQATQNASRGIPKNLYAVFNELGIVSNQKDFILLSGVVEAERDLGQGDTTKKTISTALTRCSAEIDTALKEPTFGGAVDGK